MAVTLTIAALAAAVRLGDSAEELAEITRLHAYATEAVEKYAPDAPENTANEAVVRLAAQLFDQPSASRGAYSNALRVSGAARILMPYRIHRAGSTQDAIQIAQGAVGTSGNPVIGVTVSGFEIVVTFADGTTDTQTLPTGTGTGTGDLLVERLGTLDNPTLLDDRAWLGTGVIIPDGVHVLMIDAGQASDDYHLVDWDAILMHPAVIAGNISMAGEFETFKGDAFTDLRIAHGADREVMVANDSTQSINLAHIHFERLLAPIGSGGGMFNGVDQDARDAAEAAQTDIDDHEANHPSGGSGTDQTARDAAAANTTALVRKLERNDVNAGVGISVLATTGSSTELTISLTGSGMGPTNLAGDQWEWTYNSQPRAGEVSFVGTAISPGIYEWVFDTGGSFSAARNQLLGLTAHDEIEIRQTATRHQLITLTLAPTLSGDNVTVTGTLDRGESRLLPANNSNVTILLIPGPIQGVDQTARDDAAAAQTTADTNTSALAAHAGMATAHHTPPTGGTDDAAVQALINTHAAMPNVHHAPGDGTGGPSLLGSYTGTLSNTAWTGTTLTPTAGRAMIGVIYVGANIFQTVTWHGWGMSWYPRTRFDATNAADGAWRYNFRSGGSQLIYVGRAANGNIQVRVHGVQAETFELEFWEM